MPSSLCSPLEFFWRESKSLFLVSIAVVNAGSSLRIALDMTMAEIA